MKIVEVPLFEKFGEVDIFWGVCEKILSSFEVEAPEKLGIKGGNLEEKIELIYKNAFESFDKKLFFLGGDHFLSYTLVRAFFNYSEYNGKDPCLIVFDSRPNLKKSINNKMPLSEGWLRALIEYGFPLKNILLVGVRNIEKSELNFLGEKIRRVSVEELMFDLESKTDAIMEFGYGKEVYVSIDISFLDPAYAPGTTVCEPGGLSSREFLYIIKRMSKMKNLRAVDLVEINPSKDEGNRTIELGKKIVEQFCK